jgi:hypothetical protein
MQILDVLEMVIFAIAEFFRHEKGLQYGQYTYCALDIIILKISRISND